MKRRFIVVLAVLTATVLIFGCLGYGEQQPSPTSGKTSAPGPADKKSSSATGEVKEFTITAFKFGFNPSTITVNKGDTVRLTITSTDTTHGFAIRDYNINQRIEPGKPVKIEFTADKSGTFTYACNVYCGGGHSGMKGQLIVK